MKQYKQKELIYKKKVEKMTKCVYSGCVKDATTVFNLKDNDYNYCEEHFKIVVRLYKQVIRWKL